MIVFDNKTPASFILYRRQVEHRDGAVFVADQAFNLTKAKDRDEVAALIMSAIVGVEVPPSMVDAAQVAGEYEKPMRAFPPPQPSHYETPFARAIHREYEEDHLAHYLREHMEAARLRK